MDLEGMRLYAEFALLNGGAGPSNVAHKLLDDAGYRPEVEYVPAGTRAAGFPRLTSSQMLPALVLDSGDVISSLPGILAWVTGQRHGN
jgi:hypothetical protein